MISWNAWECKVYSCTTVNTEEQPWWSSTNCFHCTPHIYSANTKASLSALYPSLNLLDLYYRPVLLVAVLVWTPRPHPTPPSPPPPAAHDELPKGFGAPIVYIASVSVVHSMPKPPDRGLFLWAQWHLAPMPGCLLPGGAVSLLLLVPY